MSDKYIKFSELPVKRTIERDELFVVANADNNVIPFSTMKSDVLATSDEKFVPKTRTINGRSLESDIVLDYATSNHTHPIATQTAPGFMSTEDRTAMLDLPFELDAKATKEQFYTLLDEMQNIGSGFTSFGDDVQLISDLEAISNPTVGLGVKVISDKDEFGNSYIWRYNGTKWDRTPFTTAPGKVPTMEDFAKKVDKTVIYNVSHETGNYAYRTATLAHNDVAIEYRKVGQIISYKTYKQEWVVEQFIGGHISYWNDLSLWAPIGGGTGLLNLTEINGTAYDTQLEARLAVQDNDRKIGQLVCYQLHSGKWVVDMFIGSSVEEWTDEGNWASLVNSLDFSDVLVQLETLTSAIDEKVDGGHIEEGENPDDPSILYLTANGETVAEIQLPAGGGGGGTSGVTMKLRAIGGTTIVAGENTDALIKWNFTSTEEDGSDTGMGTMSVSVNNIVIYTSTVQQGDGQFNVRDYIALGRNSVKLVITDSYNNVRTIRYTVQKASLTLSSVFNTAEIYTVKPVSFRYVITGAGDKTVNFTLNGIELESDSVSTSGVQLTKALHDVKIGVNTIKVTATSIIDGVLIHSNELYFEFIYAESEIQNPIIISSFNKTEAKQFETLRIPFFVYDPFNEVATVSVFVDNVLLETINAPRIEQIWEYRISQSEPIIIKLQCGSAIKEFMIDVIGTEEGISEVTDDLSFRVKAVGKSNNSTSKDKWDFGGYTTKFNNFNWSDNGWLKDADGNACLRYTGNATTSTDIRPFSSTVLSRGLTYTIEYSTSDVAEEEAVVIEQYIDGVGIKITPTSIMIDSVESGLKSYLDSSKKVSVSFVVQKRTDQRIMEIYINGILSRAVQYSETDRFNHTPTDLMISTGGNKAVVNVYAIRWYQNNLEDSQVLSNYIYDLENSVEQNQIYTRNSIINEYGNIDYTKALNYISCMKIIGELPTYKGDKKVVDISFENLQGESPSFFAKKAEIDVQGTSSQFYPRKNFKFKFKYKVNGVPTESLVTLTDTGEVVKDYTLDANTLPAKVFCMKADFAESSGTHNTGLAIIANEILKSANIKTPEQIEDDRIRTTIYGYPCLIFHQASETDTPEFIGKYNFNYDKSAENTFGFADGCESWEFKDNTSDICLFKGADFDSTYINDKGERVPTWTNHLEGRYPDESMDVSNVRQVFEWVISCKDDAAKFKAEAANWFDIDALLSYWVITELYACVDQRAKNQFLTKYSDQKWRIIFYDNDTILGIDNIGTIKFKYDVETEDVIDNGHVFNGWDSALWILVKDAYWAELTNMYNRLRTGKMTYNYSMGIFQDHEASRWAERIYNKDGYFKYVEPLLTTGENYLADLQGSRTTHRTWWLKNRFSYMDSRFKTGDYKNDFISLRLYTPTTWGGIEPNATFKLTTNKPGYVHIRFGQTDSDQVRTIPNTQFTVPAPVGMQFNDTETIVYGASALKDLGDLSDKYLGLVDVTSAVRLEKLMIGSIANKYSNTNFKNLTLGNNTLLREINLANCPNFGNLEQGSFSSNLNVSKLTVLEKLNASNTSLRSVTLPESGILTSLVLPKTITSLTLKNQTSLEKANTTFEGLSNVASLVVENTPAFDGYQLASQIINLNIANPSLKAIRLTNVNINDADDTVITKLAMMDGINEKGDILDASPVITGKAFFNTMAEYNYDLVRAKFPNLEIEVGSFVNKITFDSPLVEAIALATYDTSNKGYLNTTDVIDKTWTASLATIQEPFKFEEVRYWMGGVSAISGVVPLTHAGIKTSTLNTSTTFRNCVNLTNLLIEDGGELLTQYQKIRAQHILYCGALRDVTFYGNGRYSLSKGKQGLMAKRWLSGELTIDDYVAPLLGNVGSKLTIESSSGLPVAYTDQASNNNDESSRWPMSDVEFKNIYAYKDTDSRIRRSFNNFKITGVCRNTNFRATGDLYTSVLLRNPEGSQLISIDANTPDDKALNSVFIQGGNNIGIIINAKVTPDDIKSELSFNRGWSDKNQYTVLGSNYMPATITAIEALKTNIFVIKGGEHNGEPYMPTLIYGSQGSAIIQTLFVPDALVEDYKNDTMWSNAAVQILPVSQSPY